MKRFLLLSLLVAFVPNVFASESSEQSEPDELFEIVISPELENAVTQAVFKGVLAAKIVEQQMQEQEKADKSTWQNFVDNSFVRQVAAIVVGMGLFYELQHRYLMLPDWFGLYGSKKPTA